MSADAGCRVILIGMMGSGKSTIGRRLSKATGWPYVDNDELVRRATGATARQLLAERGEQAMREAESAALALGLETPPPAVIGVAAGTILDAANRARIRDGGIVVWLRADAAALERRAGGTKDRPWLDTGGGSWIRAAAVARDPLYASVADLTIDTGRTSRAESATELLEWLRAFDACSPMLASDLRRRAPR